MTLSMTGKAGIKKIWVQIQEDVMNLLSPDSYVLMNFIVKETSKYTCISTFSFINSKFTHV